MTIYMLLNGTPFDVVDAGDITRLLTDKVNESRIVEYKQMLPQTNERSVAQFCATITSLANSEGGHVIYGVHEQEGVPVGTPGVSGLDQDAERRRLQSYLERWVDPKITGIEYRLIPRDDGDPFLVIQVPRSWQSPHMITREDETTFYKRGMIYARREGMKTLMDAREIRNAFLQAEGLRRSMSDWRRERIEAIRTDQGAIEIEHGPRVFVHVVPFTAFGYGQDVDLTRIDRQHYLLRPLNGYGHSTFNFDGILSVQQQGGYRKPQSYLQLFRDGRVEAVDRAVFSDSHNQPGQAAGLHCTFFASQLSGLMLRVCGFLEILEVGFPIAVLVTIYGAEGLPLLHSGRLRAQAESRFNKRVMDFGDVILNQRPTDIPAMARALRPMLDALWNAAGWLKCFDFDEEGHWAPVT